MRLIVQYPKINCAAAYEVDPRWPRKPAELQWGHMPGVAVDAEDRIYCFCRSDDPVQVYASDGTFIRSWGRGRFKQPHGMRVDPQGNLWVTDCLRHVVEKYTPEGELLLRLGTDDVPGCDATHFNQPTDLAIARSGELIIADGYGNSRVVHFDPKGRFIKAWGELGVRPGQFSLPHSIGVSSQGRIYVGERNNVRVQVFDYDGKHLDEWRNLITPWGMFVTPADEIWVVGSSPMRWAEGEQLGGPPKDQIFMRFDSQGKTLALWSVPKGIDGQEKPGECNWVHGIAVDSQGSICVGDIQGRRVQKFVYRKEEAPRT